MRFLSAFGRFWWDFIVGDDWRIAAGVVVVLGGGAVLVGTGAPDGLVAAITAAGILLVAIGSIAAAARRNVS